MKQFIRVMRAPETNESNVQTAAPKPAPTSPKLEELKKAYLEAYVKRNSFADPFTEEAKAANLAVWKIEGEMKAETAEITKRENEAKLQELRNERLKLNSNMLDAYKAFITAPKNTAADKLAELESAFNTAKELVDNELLAKYASSKPAKKAENGETSSAETSASKDAIIEAYRAGKSHKDIEAMGYARSTVWHTINNAIKAGVLTKHA